MWRFGFSRVSVPGLFLFWGPFKSLFEGNFIYLKNRLKFDELEVSRLSYQNYGIDPVLVERFKDKVKNPDLRDRVKWIAGSVTKSDLQDPAKVRKLIGLVSRTLGETIPPAQMEKMVNFVVAQKIDPKNTFHLIKLWSMLR
jgi:hypothetical protein